MSINIEDALPVVKYNGLNTATNVSITGTLTVVGAQTSTGNQVVTGNESISGTSTVTGGIIGPGTEPTVFHSGMVGANSISMGTEKVAVTTEMYIVEVFIPVNTTLTGVSVLNATAVAGSVAVALANSTGTVVTSSGGASASGTQAFQQFPFSATYAAVGPAKYFILLESNNTGYKFYTHTVGNFGAAKTTGQVYGTFPAITPATTFTTALGPIADTY